jgi:DNA-binding protein YbaB
VTVDYQQMVEELTQEYEKAKARTGELRREVSELNATATAPRETVKVTVGAQGDVRSIEFPTSAYKRMPPAELSAALMETINEAKDKAHEMLNELMTPSMPGGLKFMEVMQGKVEPSALGDARPGMPGIVRDYLSGGPAAAEGVDGNG